MTTFSTSLKLELPGDGQQSGTWGQTTNKNIGTLIEQAITGVEYIDMLDTDVTLTNLNGTVDQARNAVLVMEGTNTTIRDVIAPLVNKIYIIKNATLGGYNIRIKGVTGNAVTVENGNTLVAYCNGTDFNIAVDPNNVTGDLDITGNLSVTGNETIGGTLLVTGVTTLTAKPILSSLTASQAVFSDSSKGLVSNPITGTGNVVMSASPTLTGTASLANVTASGTLGVTGLTSLANVTASGTLGVTGLTSLANVTASGTLGVTGLTSLANVTASGTLGVTGVATFTAQPIVSSLTASQAVFSDSSKGLVSNPITGTGNVVMSASPTLTGTLSAANVSASGTLGVTGVATFTAQPVVSSLTASQAVFSDGSKGLVSNPITGTGNVVMSASPTLTGTASLANVSYTGTLTGGTGVVNIGSGQVYKDASGNVGIGTSSPQSKLDIGGNTTSSGVADISISRTGTPSFSVGNGANIQFSNTDAIASDYGMLQFTDGVFQLFQYSNGSSAWVGGNLASGITSAVAATNNNKTGLFYQNDGNIIIAHANASATGYFMSFQYGGVVTGYINGISGGAGVAYTNASDYRLKKDVAPMTGALDKVAKLKPVTFTWKMNDCKSEGFIAHELQEVCPVAVVGEKDAVNEDGSIKAQAIDTSYLVATLTAAIQEQQAIIKQLQADVTALKAK